MDSDGYLDREEFAVVRNCTNSPLLGSVGYLVLDLVDFDAAALVQTY